MHEAAEKGEVEVEVVVMVVEEEGACVLREGVKETGGSLDGACPSWMEVRTSLLAA